MFDDVWWFFITYDMDHVASMSSSRTFRTSWHIHAHNIYIYTTCSIYLLTCSNVGPLEDACARLGGNARKRQRVDRSGDAREEIARLGKRVANPGPSCWHLGSILWSLKPWRIRIGLIGAGSFGVGPSSAVLNKQKAYCRGPKKVCSQALLWNTLIWLVAHETRGLLRRCHVA